MEIESLWQQERIEHWRASKALAEYVRARPGHPISIVAIVHHYFGKQAATKRPSEPPEEVMGLIERYIDSANALQRAIEKAAGQPHVPHVANQDLIRVMRESRSTVHDI